MAQIKVFLCVTVRNARNVLICWSALAPCYPGLEAPSVNMPLCELGRCRSPVSILLMAPQCLTLTPSISCLFSLRGTNHLSKCVIFHRIYRFVGQSRCQTRRLVLAFQLSDCYAQFTKTSEVSEMLFSRTENQWRMPKGTDNKNTTCIIVFFLFKYFSFFS